LSLSEPNTFSLGQTFSNIWDSDQSTGTKLLQTLALSNYEVPNVDQRIAMDQAQQASINKLDFLEGNTFASITYGVSQLAGASEQNSYAYAQLAGAGFGILAAGSLGLQQLQQNSGLLNVLDNGASSLVNGARLDMQLTAEQAAGVRMPTQITGYSDRALEQIASRDGGIGVDQNALLDAWDNPSQINYVPSKYGPTFRLTGNNAAVVVNADGKVVTGWATSAAGAGQ
jgi:hypothetical protein